MKPGHDARLHFVKYNQEIIFYFTLTFKHLLLHFEKHVFYSNSK